MRATSSDTKLKRAYAYFSDAETTGRVFTLEEVVSATGYSAKTVKAYSTKKWHFFIQPADHGYRCSGLVVVSEDAFMRLHAQRASLDGDVLRPRFAPDVDALIDKSREAALLAVQIYNNPLVSFRAPGYIVQMIIAYTALFHAVFQRRGSEYWYKHDDGSPLVVDGEHRYWELGECIKQYYQGRTTPETENLRLFIGLRNKIEHRFIPALDGSIAGYCQALLLNFEQLLVAEFGQYFVLGNGLALALQLSSFSAELQAALRRIQAQHFRQIRTYIDDFTSHLPAEIAQSSNFCFRVFAFPRLGNHASSSDKMIEFVKYDPSDPAQMQQYERQVAFIKERQVQVADQGKLLASDVVRRVKEITGLDFNMSHHTKAWRLYAVRSGRRIPSDCNVKYCQYSVPFKNWIYTEAWVTFLCAKIRDPEEFERIKRYQPC